MIESSAARHPPLHTIVNDKTYISFHGSPWVRIPAPCASDGTLCGDILCPGAFCRWLHREGCLLCENAALREYVGAQVSGATA